MSPVVLLGAIVLVSVAFAGLAAGVILSNRRIQGSCGGLANFKDANGRSICEACTDPAPECRQMIEDYAAAERAAREVDETAPLSARD